MNLFGMRSIYGQKSGPNHVLRVEPRAGSLILHCPSSLYCNYGPLAIDNGGYLVSVGFI